MINKLNKRIKYKNDIKGMQFVALEILKEFDKVCRENKIEYWITDGTLLGAIRHKGFIPWDDDIDVCIRSEDEKKFNKIMKNKLPYYLYFYDKNKLKDKRNYNFYKIKDRYSYVKEPIQVKDNKGIWIDIFPMTSIKENKLIGFMINLIPDVKNNPKDNLQKKILRMFIYKILKILNFEDKSLVIKKFYNIFINKEGKDSVIYMEGQEWWHTYKKEWIFPLKEIEFEGYRFLAPNNPEKYLKSYYGKNYMKLPPENKRTTHSIKIDLFNSNNHPESLKWDERENHIKKYIKELKVNER